MWQNRLILLSLFFVIGIVIGMQFPLEPSILPVLAGAALAVCVLSLMMARNGQHFMPLFLLAGFAAGWLNFSWKIDDSAPDHLTHFTDDIEFEDYTELGGWIVKEPEIRPYKTNIVVKPDYIRIDEQGEKRAIGGGLVMLQLRPSMGSAYSDFNYGDYIITKHASLTRPDTANNPGIFDYRIFLRNNGIYGLMNIRKAFQLSRDTDKTYHNPVVDFALELKQTFLRTIKKTMPYPESAFLGGIMLGLRQGLSREVQDDFRAAGVAHVLAVSGLHVTIITALLFGLLTLFKVPRTLIAWPTIAGLIIFAIITGARPSTLRAVIMNGIALISFCHFASNLRTSLLFGIAMAALSILFVKPMILFEASFLYSFMAVLALALLTGPILSFFNKYLNSAHAIFLFLFSCVLLGTVMIDPFRTIDNPPFALVLFFILFVISYIFRGFFPASFRFSRLPYWFTSFTAAQMAIQLGLGPLNALYFQKYSLAAPLANFIAIPLIGVNVQLGMFAGLLGFVPVIGEYLSLVINASNWLAVRLFLGSATFFARSIPYPDMTPPPVWLILIYYSFLGYIAYQKRVHTRLKPFLVFIRHTLNSAALRRRFQVALVSFLLFVGSGLIGFYTGGVQPLEITVFDLTVFGMGGGTAQLVELPDRRTLMVDAGLAQVSMRGKNLDWNMGEMIISRVLRNKRIRVLDWLVLTCPDAECSGGMLPLLSGFTVRYMVEAAHFPVDILRPDLGLTTFLDLLDDDYYKQKSDADFVSQTYAHYINLVTAVSQSRETQRMAVSSGTRLVNTEVNDQKLVVEVLHPPSKRLKLYRTTTNNSLVLKINYGEFSCLLPSLLTIDGEKCLLELGDRLQARVLIAPCHGFKGSCYAQFVQAVDPELVIIQTTPSRWKQKEVEQSVHFYRKFGYKTLRTDQVGAVILTSNGSGYQVRSMIND
ncbi:ComEC/Rec2 family competence protein [bacterium]|nr:ComEC/Rec2 family competence protein [bacterium]